MKDHNQSKLIEMKLTEKTLSRIEKLTELMNTDNRAQVVAASVKIADNLISMALDGSKIIFEKPDGTKQQISFKGITA